MYATDVTVARGLLATFSQGFSPSKLHSGVLSASRKHSSIKNIDSCIRIQNCNRLTSIDWRLETYRCSDTNLKMVYQY